MMNMYKIEFITTQKHTFLDQHKDDAWYAFDVPIIYSFIYFLQ
jgi:hypothetical protein